MHAQLSFAIAAALLATACASPTVSSTGASASAAPVKGTYYCWRDRLAEGGEDLTCNWESSVSEACRSTGVVTLKKGAIAGAPRPAGMCTNGQWLVAVNAR